MESEREKMLLIMMIRRIILNNNKLLKEREMEKYKRNHKKYDKRAGEKKSISYHQDWSIREGI